MRHIGWRHRGRAVDADREGNGSSGAVGTEISIVLTKLALAFLFVMFILAPCLIAYNVDLDLSEPPER